MLIWLLQTLLVFIQVYHIKPVWKHLERHWIKSKHKVPTGKLIGMAEFVLRNNYFQFLDKVYQISRTAIGTKFAPPYACIFMDQVEIKFL